MKYLSFASESVCAGHPDKICDQVSDAVLDSALFFDKNSRVAIETLVTQDKVIIAGEVTCNQKIDFKNVAQRVITNLGYNNNLFKFSSDSEIEVFVHEQSADIALGADNDGAGDQGMMFGYACKETPQFMPLPIVIAHDLCRKMDELQNGVLDYLRPDGKAEVVVQYENGKPKKVAKIILAKPFDQKISDEQIKHDLYKFTVLPILEKYNLNLVPMEDVVLNGTGRWEIGGPSCDTGVTGRKIVVDSYGGMGRLGGGCFSGKDPTKVDRSAAYAARYLAKNVVANNFADRCEVSLAYVIGHKYPVLQEIEFFDTEKGDTLKIKKFVWNLMDLSVKGIIDKFDLKRPIYSKTATYGHFGHADYPWEKLVRK
jgi:S-adenosylmethionine synthetase